MTKATNERIAAPTKRLVWVGLGVFGLGRVIDLVWHATHPEFETAGDQVRAHAVVWLGALILLVAALRAVGTGLREGGYLFLLSAVMLDVLVSIWHFWEHYNQRDPNLPHVLLLVANIGIFAAVGWIWLAAVKRRSSRGMTR